jgi:hypothetical protein
MGRDWLYIAQTGVTFEANLTTASIGTSNEAPVSKMKNVFHRLHSTL